MSCSTKGNHGIIKFSASEAGTTLTKAREKFHALTLEAREEMVANNQHPEALVEDPNEYLAFLNAQRRQIQQAVHMSPEEKRDALVDLEARISMVEANGRPLPTQATMRALRALPAALHAVSTTNRPTAAPASHPNSDASNDTNPVCEQCGQPATHSRTYRSTTQHYYCADHARGLRRSGNWSRITEIPVTTTSAGTPIDPDAALSSFLSAPNSDQTGHDQESNVLWYEDLDSTDGIVRRSQRVSVTDPNGNRYEVEATVHREPNGSYTVEVVVYPESDSHDELPTVIARENVTGSLENAASQALSRITQFSGRVTDSANSAAGRCGDCGQFLPVDDPSGHRCPDWDEQTAGWSDEDEYDEIEDGYDEYRDEYDEDGSWNPLPASPEWSAWAANPRTAPIPAAIVADYDWTWMPASTPHSYMASARASDANTGASLALNAQVEAVAGAGGYRVVVTSDGQPIAERTVESSSLEEAQRVAQEYMARFAGLVENGHAYRCDTCGRFLSIDGSQHTCPSQASESVEPPRGRREHNTGEANLSGARGSLNDTQAALQATVYRNNHANVPDHVDPVEATEAYEYLSSSAGWMRDSLGRIESDLVARLDAADVREISDPEHDDISLSVVGGRVWKEWDADGVNARLATQIGQENGLDAGDVAVALSAYNEFAQVSRFRSEPLRDIGADPATYATPEEAPRRLELRGLPRDRMDIPTAALVADRASLTAAVERLASDEYRQQISDLPVEQAVAEYASAYRAYRWLRAAESAAEERATTLLTEQGGRVTLDDGQVIEVRQGRAYRKFDREAADAALAPVVAERSGHSPEQVRAILSRYNEFAAVTGFRVRAMRAIGLEDDSYSHQEAPRARVVRSEGSVAA